MTRSIAIQLTLAATLLLTACSSSPTSTSTSARSSPATAPTTSPVFRASLGPLGQPGCHPPSPVSSRPSGPGPEVEGTSPNAELWALLFASPPIHAGDEVKIVWRMTGSGALRIAGTGPAGTPARLTFGPEEHSGSTWARPGDEWGTGFVFPSSGCWDIHAARDQAAGDVWILVQ